VKGGGVAELVKLREEGFINEVSLGMNDAYFVQRMLNDNPAGTFDSVMMAGSWNLLDQDGLLVLLECQRRGVKVRVYFYYCTVN
jgi:D-threo-aldose 1-dehydrogenase